MILFTSLVTFSLNFIFLLYLWLVLDLRFLLTLLIAMLSCVDHNDKK